MKIRRVVTQNDSQNKSFVLHDQAVTNVETPLANIDERLKFYNLWITDSMPVDLAGADLVHGTRVSTTPMRNGSLFRIVRYPPEAQLLESLAKMSKAELSQLGDAIGVKFDLNGKHLLMHSTESLDYAIVLSGEIYLVLDTEETLLKPLDVVIQRGTNHAWSNRSTSDCVMAYVLLSSKAI